MSEPLCIFHVDLNFVCLKPDYIRRWLRDLAGMGYNAILWELEDKIQWDSCPEAVWPEALSKDEFRLILAEAKALGLESIPLLQTVGHGEYVLMQDAYRHMRELPEHHDCYCTENPAVRKFLKGLITEYLDLFGEIRHFHLGGDEAYVFAQCPVCSAKATAVGRNAVYADHIMDISGPIRQRGARAGIWCDMVMNHPEQMAAIPRELEIWDWNYWDLDGPMEAVRVWGKGRMCRDELTDELRQQYPEILGDDGMLRGFYTSDALLRMGYDVFLSSAVRSSGDSVFCARTLLHAQNIAGAARKTANAGLLGTCVTDWAVRLNSWETHRTILPVAPRILSDPTASLETVRSAIAAEAFGTDPAKFIAATDVISGTVIPFAQAHTTAIQWDKLKDSLPAPEGYIRDLLASWQKSGRLATERATIDARIEQLRDAGAQLDAFVAEATAGLELLEYWTRAARCQLWQARMGREILAGNRTPDNVAALRALRDEYEHLLNVDQTPQSAAKNAGLVFDCLIEYMEQS